MLRKNELPYKKVKINLKELFEALQLKNIPAQGKLENIHQVCANNNVPLTEKEYKITEGWMLKLKGMLQVLYKRCWIDKEKLALYSKDPVKDDKGSIIDNTYSLKVIMVRQSDFVNETTLLQHNLKELAALRGGVLYCFSNS